MDFFQSGLKESLNWMAFEMLQITNVAPDLHCSSRIDAKRHVNSQPFVSFSIISVLLV